jgi:glycerophosphoryl diester phosphodiesterase
MAVFHDVPVRCGHRGSGKGPDENTLASFLRAAEAGVPWVEVDVRVSGDRRLVAHHDPRLADGRLVSELPAADTGLMLLDDLLEALPAAVGIDIDLKSSLEDAVRPAADSTAALVAAVAERERGRRPLLVTSFDPAALLIVRERAPAVPLGLITWKRFPLQQAVPAAAHLGADVLAAHYESFRGGRDRAIAIAHEAGLQVMAWCPPPRKAEVLRAAGVDCLVLDGVA